MGLSSLLARWGVAGAHVLVVESPGSWLTRATVERALERRGWRTALSPADADLLVVCGQPGDRLAEIVEQTWDLLPGPRTRVQVEHAEHVEPMLDAARAGLLDEQGQRQDAARRPLAPPRLEEGTQAESADDGDMGGMVGDDMDDMDDMDMSGPAGIALAGGESDRDGLEMDVLHVPLGPVLPHWPPGLVLWCTLQGDVLTAAEVDVLASSAPAPRGSAGPQVARRLDAAVDLLALAGWQAAAGEVRALRDGLLVNGPDPGPDGAAPIQQVHDKVARSRTLRWALRGLGHLDGPTDGPTDGPPDSATDGSAVPAGLAGDVYDRLLALLSAAGDALDRAPEVDRTPVLRLLPELVVGLDVAAARLVVASLGPWQLAALPVAAGGGRG